MSEHPAARLACHELVELVTDHLEGALDACARARFEAHLASCPDCAAYVEQMRRTIAALGELREEHLPAGLLDALLDAFRRWRGEAADER